MTVPPGFPPGDTPPWGGYPAPTGPPPAFGAHSAVPIPRRCRSRPHAVADPGGRLSHRPGPGRAAGGRRAGTYSSPPRRTPASPTRPTADTAWRALRIRAPSASRRPWCSECSLWSSRCGTTDTGRASPARYRQIGHEVQSRRRATDRPIGFGRSVLRQFAHIIDGLLQHRLPVPAVGRQTPDHRRQDHVHRLPTDLTTFRPDFTDEETLMTQPPNPADNPPPSGNPPPSSGPVPQPPQEGWGPPGWAAARYPPPRVASASPPPPQVASRRPRWLPASPGAYPPPAGAYPPPPGRLSATRRIPAPAPGATAATAHGGRMGAAPSRPQPLQRR